MKQRSGTSDKMLKPFNWKPVEQPSRREGDVLYFAGCMSHLTPSVMQATTNVLSKAGIRFSILDEQGGICCGRPAMQAGFSKQAEAMITRTSELIEQSGASLLLVSCPICYKVFNENYHLTIPVEHHTVFFRNLLEKKPELAGKLPFRMSYHDPCDLGRGSGIFDAPREILHKTGTLVPAANTGKDALCCGGSLANLEISPAQRTRITHAAYSMLTANAPDFLVTACPLCKKTFSAGKPHIPVMDIAEILVLAMDQQSKRKDAVCLPQISQINAEI
jgi:Fe-S oxidoreductase